MLSDKLIEGGDRLTHKRTPPGHLSSLRLPRPSTHRQEGKIIAVTASLFEGERAVVLVAGRDSFLSQPFRKASIFDMLAKHLSVEGSAHP